MTEYGRVNDTKKGWKTVNTEGSDTPIPLLDDMANAFRYQLVIVSGTVALKVR